MIPTIIYDDFFEDPDKIVEYANTLDYSENNSNYPGIRSNLLHEINPDLYSYIAHRIIKIFYPDSKTCGFESLMGFQKINPLHIEKYNNKNRGWIHRDINSQFGGIVYLNKNPEPDTGTSIYEPKRLDNLFYNGYSNEIKNKFYRGEEVSDDEYEMGFTSTEDNWKETVKVENVYNRLFAFNGRSWHGVKTFGSDERLTLVFFFKYLFDTGIDAPLDRL
jgi:hypothetical protein|tara:strand:- start:290 stop:946 length:657 start_codon:yes stop_codon:yes gene_type:complete